MNVLFECYALFLILLSFKIPPCHVVVPHLNLGNFPKNNKNTSSNNNNNWNETQQTTYKTKQHQEREKETESKAVGATAQDKKKCTQSVYKIDKQLLLGVYETSIFGSIVKSWKPNFSHCVCMLKYVLCGIRCRCFLFALWFRNECLLLDVGALWAHGT